MPSVDRYVLNAQSLADDVDTVANVLDTAQFVTSQTSNALDLPGDIADYLDAQARAIDLPNVIVNALGGLPYGIGFAIKQLNNVSNTVGFTVERQADVLHALDTSWKPAQLVVTTLDYTLQGLSLTADGYSVVTDNRATEADLLSRTMGGGTILAGTELATRMEAYNASYEPWDARRDALLAPVQQAMSALSDAATEIVRLMPDFASITDVMSRALSAFTGAADIARSIYDSLNVTVDLGFLGSFNLIKTLETITNFIGLVQDAIEGIVIDILNTIGFNTNIFAGVENLMMTAMQPLFDVFATLSTVMQPVIDQLNTLVDTLDYNMTELLARLGDAVGIETLFDHEVAVLDTMGGRATGGDGEDGVFGNAGNDSLDGGKGQDFMFGGDGDDRMLGRWGDDEMYGGAGDDLIIGGYGDDIVDGGTGRDTVQIRDAIGNVTIIDGGSRMRIISSEGDDTFVGVENFNMDGQLYTRAQMLSRATARDIAGGAGNDHLTGLPGSDTLHGNAGDDTLDGGAGGDILDGGRGHDLVSYANATRSVRVDLQNDRFMYGDAVGDSFVDIEAFRAGDFADQLRGDANGNEFYGGGSTDRLFGRAGDDLLLGESGTDAFYGGQGADTMSGGSDAGQRDRFIFFNMVESGVGAGNRDVITDFVAGEDRIEISRFDADLTQGFRQRFTFVDDTAFSGTAGELRYQQIGGNTIVQADVTGDGLADFEIELTGRMALSAGDFLI